MIELDTAIDVASRLRELRPNADVQWWVESPGDSRQVPESELFSLSQADRGRLILRAPEEGATGNQFWNGVSTIPFRLDDSPWISIVQDPDESVTTILQAIIADNGRVRFIRHPVAWRALVAYLPAVLVTGCAAWSIATLKLPLPEVALAIALALFTFVASVPFYRRRAAERLGAISRNPGHFIRMESRAEQAQRRANTRRDVVVALISVGATAVVGVIVGFLTGVLPPNP